MDLDLSNPASPQTKKLSLSDIPSDIKFLDIKTGEIIDRKKVLTDKSKNLVGAYKFVFDEKRNLYLIEGGNKEIFLKNGFYYGYIDEKEYVPNAYITDNDGNRLIGQVKFSNGKLSLQESNWWLIEYKNHLDKLKDKIFRLSIFTSIDITHGSVQFTYLERDNFIDPRYSAEHFNIPEIPQYLKFLEALKPSFKKYNIPASKEVVIRNYDAIPQRTKDTLNILITQIANKDPRLAQFWTQEIVGELFVTDEFIDTFGPTVDWSRKKEDLIEVFKKLELTKEDLRILTWKYEEINSISDIVGDIGFGGFNLFNTFKKFQNLILTKINRYSDNGDPQDNINKLLLKIKKVYDGRKFTDLSSNYAPPDYQLRDDIHDYCILLFGFFPYFCMLSNMLFATRDSNGKYSLEYLDLPIDLLIEILKYQDMIPNNLFGTISSRSYDREKSKFILSYFICGFSIFKEGINLKFKPQTSFISQIFDNWRFLNSFYSGQGKLLNDYNSYFERDEYNLNRVYLEGLQSLINHIKIQIGFQILGQKRLLEFGSSEFNFYLHYVLDEITKYLHYQTRTYQIDMNTLSFNWLFDKIGIKINLDLKSFIFSQPNILYALGRFGPRKSQNNLDSDVILSMYSDFFIDMKNFIKTKLFDDLPVGLTVSEYIMRPKGYEHRPTKTIKLYNYPFTENNINNMITSIFYENKLIVIRDSAGEAVCVINKYGILKENEILDGDPSQGPPGVKKIITESDKYSQWIKQWKNIGRENEIFSIYPFLSLPDLTRTGFLRYLNLF